MKKTVGKLLQPMVNVDPVFQKTIREEEARNCQASSGKFCLLSTTEMESKS